MQLPDRLAGKERIKVSDVWVVRRKVFYFQRVYLSQPTPNPGMNMKRTRILLAGLLVAFAAAACDGNVTGPTENLPCPVIGSGIGTC